MVRALRYRNYRLFFGGQIISFTGSWITATATGWLVYRLTSSAMLLGVVGFAAHFPVFVVGPFAGIVADRFNRRRLLVVTQTLSMLQSLALAALTLSGGITVEAIVVLCIVQGIVGAFDIAARQAFLIELIDRKEDLANAIALHSSMVNVARLVGPSVAGAVIVVAGEGWCFLLDGISYLFVIGALLAMRLPAARGRPPLRGRVLEGLAEGVAYAFGFRPMRAIILLLAVMTLVGVPSSTLMPVFAATVFHGTPRTLGLLLTASACGALAGTLWLAGRKSAAGLVHVLPVAGVLFGAGLIVFSFVRVLWLAASIMAITGFGFMTLMAGGNTILQTIVDDEKRGRVMSFYLMAFIGTVPFGNLIGGVLSSHIGAPRTLLIDGICGIAAALWFTGSLPAIRAAVRARIGE